MKNAELKEKLIHSDSLDEVKGPLSECPDIDAERIRQENENHRSGKHEKLDLDELDAVSGGSGRDWKREGCAATCEEDCWCGSNVYCMIWDVAYDDFWACCPDSHDHVYQGTRVCVHCGYEMSGGDFRAN